MGGGANIYRDMPARVLIIEDEMVTQHLLTRLVGSEGHSVSVAQSCAEAEALAMRESRGTPRYPRHSEELV